MSTPAGQRNRRIQFQRGAPVVGGLGTEPVTNWATFGSGAWAKVTFGTGAERRQAAAEQASQSATFRVLSNSGTRAVVESDRILFAGRGWDISSISPIGVNAEIEFVATVSKG